MKLSPLVIFATGIVTAILAVPAASWAGLENWLSITASSVAFTLMGVNLVLGARYPGVESLFGGLDRVYVAHKWTGISALVLILAHYFVKPNFQGLALSSAANIAAAEVGKYAFYTLVVLILISFFKRLPKVPFEIPYGIWRITHKFMGLAFVLVAFHQFFIKRPFTGAEMLSSWLNVWAFIGIVSYGYSLLAPLFRQRSYAVESIEKHPAATVAKLKPLKTGVNVSPGQFAFISVKGKGLAEPHPFTVAGALEDNAIEFAIRPLGDFTRRLRERLEPGDVVRVSGGHGKFQAARGGKRQIWLAGGIGITPFLAFARNMPSNGAVRQYHLVHCVSSADQAIGRAQFEEVAAQNENFSYTLHCSDSAGRLDYQGLLGHLSFDADGADLWYCGPPAMRQAIEKGLAGAGVKLARVEFERFEFR